MKRYDDNKKWCTLRDKLRNAKCQEEQNELIIAMYELENNINLGKEVNSCDCGAKHTVFPEAHYNWCSTKR